MSAAAAGRGWARGWIITAGEPELLWAPTPESLSATELGRYLRWLSEHRRLEFADYSALHQWSISDLEGFWASVWEFFEIRAQTPYEQVLGERKMPGASWFTGSRLNYAAHAVGRDEDLHRVAVIAHSQTREPIQLTFSELRDQVARARAGLLRLGVGPGDLVAAYLPNIPETVIAFLAAASIGAVWAACAPEFGPHSVISRFGVVAPKLLLTIAGYRYGDRVIDRRGDVAAIRAGLPTLEHVVHVPYVGGEEDVIPAASAWDTLLAESGPLDFTALPFDHPLFVLFSSGTTGLPKAIKHCHGGILIEHCKNHGLSWDLGPGDRLMWFSTTAWMMWNALVSGLLVRASIVLIDGNPVHPGLDYQWRLAAETRPTTMGASPAFLMACRKADLRPAEDLDLSSLRQLGAAGSPLAPEGFDWVYERLPSRVLLNNGSGGTDVCTGMVQGGPMLPVYRGEIAGRCLAVDTAAYDPDGQVVIDRLGELVIRAPMPSMPIGFFNDPGDRRYRAAYFEEFAGVWRHGDWVRFTTRGSCVITGRSDATLNRAGVRLGTGELYAVIEDLREIADSLVVHLEDSQGGPGELLLFVVLVDGVTLDQPLRDRIAATLRGSLSPRHVPDTIEAVSAIPTTLTAKKLELPVKRILLGAPAEDVASRDALAQPNALDDFVAYASTRRAGGAADPSPGPR